MRRPANCRRMAESTWLTSRATASEDIATTDRTSSTSAATSQTVPVVPMLRGSGGGAPVGRRRRRVRRAVGGPATTLGRRGAGGVVDGHGSCSASSHRVAVERTDPESCTRGVELAERLGVQPRRDRVQGLDQARPEPIGGLPAHDRGDVLRRLERAVVDQLDQGVGADPRVRAEEQRDVDDAGRRAPGGSAARRRRGRRPPRTRCRTPCAAPPGTAAGSRIRAARRRSTRATPRAGRSARVSPSRSATSRRTTKALVSWAGAAARARATVPSSARTRAAWVAVTSASGCARPMLRNCTAVPAYSGTTSTSPSRQRGRDQLARPEAECPPHGEPGPVERLAVDLGEQAALGEVERRDRDDVVRWWRRRGPPLR